MSIRREFTDGNNAEMSFSFRPPAGLKIRYHRIYVNQLDGDSRADALFHNRAHDSYDNTLESLERIAGNEGVTATLARKIGRISLASSKRAIIISDEFLEYYGLNARHHFKSLP